jgi:hypothetical protein
MSLSFVKGRAHRACERLVPTRDSRRARAPSLPSIGKCTAGCLSLGEVLDQPLDHSVEREYEPQ